MIPFLSLLEDKSDKLRPGQVFSLTGKWTLTLTIADRYDIFPGRTEHWEWILHNPDLAGQISQHDPEFWDATGFDPKDVNSIPVKYDVSEGKIKNFTIGRWGRNRQFYEIMRQEVGMRPIRAMVRFLSKIHESAEKISFDRRTGWSKGGTRTRSLRR